MSVTEDKAFKVRNRGLLQFCRWLLSLLCLSAGGFLLLGGERIGISIILLLIGVWLVLDNPLESFETLEGSCPSCHQDVRSRRSISFRCSACGRLIMVGAECFYLVDSESILHSESRPGEGALEETSQAEPVVIDPGDTLDLHTFSPKELPSVLDEFIHLSQKANVKLVSIIHGKGTGALRRRVRGLLARDPRAVAFYDAPRKSGGWGATIVELKPEQSKDDGER